MTVQLVLSTAIIQHQNKTTYNRTITKEFKIYQPKNRTINCSILFFSTEHDLGALPTA